MYNSSFPLGLNLATCRGATVASGTTRSAGDFDSNHNVKGVGTGDAHQAAKGEKSVRS